VLLLLLLLLLLVDTFSVQSEAIFALRSDFCPGRLFRDGMANIIDLEEWPLSDGIRTPRGNWLDKLATFPDKLT
jgi:hypothetical protein